MFCHSTLSTRRQRWHTGIEMFYKEFLLLLQQGILSDRCFREYLMSEWHRNKIIGMIKLMTK